MTSKPKINNKYIRKPDQRVSWSVCPVPNCGDVPNCGLVPKFADVPKCPDIAKFEEDAGAEATPGTGSRLLWPGAGPRVHGSSKIEGRQQKIQKKTVVVVVVVEK